MGRREARALIITSVPEQPRSSAPLHTTVIIKKSRVSSFDSTPSTRGSATQLRRMHVTLSPHSSSRSQALNRISLLELLVKRWTENQNASQMQCRVRSRFFFNNPLGIAYCCYYSCNELCTSAGLSALVRARARSSCMREPVELLTFHPLISLITVAMAAKRSEKANNTGCYYREPNYRGTTTKRKHS